MAFDFSGHIGTRVLKVALIGTLLGACEFEKEDKSTNATTSQQPPAQPAPAPAQPQAATLPDSLRDLHFLVDISDRTLYVLNGTDTLRKEDVAVGKKDHPTPTGEWKIKRVDFNPDWTPPPGEDWTEDKDPQPPGAPRNPMGRARLVFEEPYSIHGTKERESLGTATSHGSIRVANEVVVPLGRMVLEAGGATQPERFYRDVAANRKEMRQVPVPNPVPIAIRE